MARALVDPAKWENHGLMDFPQIWPHLSRASRSWLIEHNGEPLPDLLVAEVLSVAGGGPNAQWWRGPYVEGQTQLTDEAVDWIETVANDES
jgi:hypothetical protein